MSAATRMINTDFSCTSGIPTVWFVEWSPFPPSDKMGVFVACGRSSSSSFMEQQVNAMSQPTTCLGSGGSTTGFQFVCLFLSQRFR